MNRLMKFLALLAVAAASTGCQNQSESRVTATGSVTCDGKPLSGAVITLEPMPGTSGPNASAPVFDGRFEIGSDASLHGGKYVARFAMIPVELRNTIPSAQRSKLPPDDSVIGPEYDANSQLSCELVSGQNNSLEFSIQFHH